MFVFVKCALETIAVALRNGIIHAISSNGICLCCNMINTGFGTLNT